jgi:hypothetical protein
MAEKRPGLGTSFILDACPDRLDFWHRRIKPRVYCVKTNSSIAFGMVSILLNLNGEAGGTQPTT